MRPISAILGSMLLASALVAQQNIVWNLNNSPSGTRNAYPWGAPGLRYQALVSGSLLGSTPAWIQDIMIPGDTADIGAREVIYDDIEIRLGMTPATTLATAWATNNPNPVTVYRGYLRAVFQPNAWRGLGLPASFLYVPTPAAPNLCVEVINWAIRGQTPNVNFFFPAADASLPRAFFANWINNQTMPPTVSASSGAKFGLLLNDGNYVLVGAGCNSSASQPVTISGPANAWPTRGMPFPISLSGLASRPSYLLLGVSDTLWGAIQLPVNLAFLGAPNCFVWNDALLVTATATNASGSATLSLPIPNTFEFAGLRLFASWAQIDPGANPFGLTTSGQMKLIVNR